MKRVAADDATDGPKPKRGKGGKAERPSRPKGAAKLSLEGALAAAAGPAGAAAGPAGATPEEDVDDHQFANMQGRTKGEELLGRGSHAHEYRDDRDAYE